MNQIYLFFLLFFIISIVGSIDYHGKQRYWTFVNNETTYIGLHVLATPIKLIFSRQKTFADLISNIKLFSPTGNGKCEDKNHTLGFKLEIADQNYIRGEIKIHKIGPTEFLTAFLYETCAMFGGSEHNYVSPGIDVSPTSLETTVRACYKNGAAPFKLYDKDIKMHVMELQVFGSFECQIFMELPKDVEIEDFSLPNAPYLALNSTFDGNNASFWWKKDNDKMIPSAVSFDGSGNVEINIFNSTKDIPYFLRIGQNQPLPSLQFQFGAQCDGSQFEVFLNLHDSSECKINIHLTQTGFQIATKNGGWKNISDTTKSPILIFGENKMYVKVASPLSINEFETCNFTTSADVPSDQFVLQLGRNSIPGNCVKSKVLLPKTDVKNGIEVLIDRLLIVENTTENETTNETLIFSTTTETSSAGMDWWWFVVAGVILIVVIAIIVIVYCICRCRRRRIQKQKEQNLKSCEPRISTSADVKTGVLKEESPKREIKEKRKSKTKTKEEEINESKKGGKPKTNLIKYDPGPHSFQAPSPGKLVTFEKDGESKSDKRVTAKTQNDATTVETVSTTQQTGPEPKAGLKSKAKVVEDRNVYPVIRLVQEMKDEE